MAWHDLEIARVVEETPLDRTFALAVPEELTEAFVFTPGAFLLVRDPEEAKRRQRAYSISSAPEDDAPTSSCARSRATALSATSLPSPGPRTTIPGRVGRRGRPDRELLASLAGDVDQTVLYICGPNPFVDALVQIAGDLGVPSDRVRREKWG